MPPDDERSGSAMTRSCGIPKWLRGTRHEHSSLTGASCAVLYCAVHKDFIKQVSLSRRGAPKYNRPEKKNSRRSKRAEFAFFILIRWNHAEEPWVSESPS